MAVLNPGTDSTRLRGDRETAFGPGTAGPGYRSDRDGEPSGGRSSSWGSSPGADTRHTRVDEGVTAGIHRALEALPGLFRNLAADFSELLSLKAALLKAELSDSIKHYLKDGLFLGIGAVVALTALPLLEITLGLLIAWAIPIHNVVGRLALGFLILTLINGGVAGFFVMKGLRDLSKRTIVPKRTMQDLERDKQWLANGLK